MLETFIEDYIEYACKLCASPRKFHRMMAYSMLSQVIGRRAIYHKSGPPIGPNLWTLILAPSSTMAKSSALSIGRRILNHAYLDSHAHLLPVGGSSENFFERLEESPSGILLSSEFCNLVNWFKLSYANDIHGLLLDAYDQPSAIFKSIGTNHKGNKKDYVIRNPFVNAYAVSSYDLFNSVITHSFLTGGFLARWFIVREDSSDNYQPFTSPLDETKEMIFSDKLREILTKDAEPRTFDYDEEATKLYESWFNDYLKPTIKNSGHFMIPPYCQRRGTDVHKFAMIHAILRGSTGTMNKNDLEGAIMLCQESISDAIYLIDNKISMSRDESEWNRLIEYIKRFSDGSGVGAPHWKVAKYSKIPAFQFDRHIQTLLGMNKIEVINLNKEGIHYREI